MSNLTKVQEFHKAFNIGKAFDIDTLNLRFSLLMEEWNEYCDAQRRLRTDLNCKIGKQELLDAMCDMVYIIYGTADVFDMDIDGAFAEVHASNMSKLDKNGKPLINGINCPMDMSRPKGKVLKSDQFFEPNLKPFLNNKDNK